MHIIQVHAICLIIVVLCFFVCSFIDENGDRYSALTVLTINGEDVLAVNSSKVLSYGREYYSCPNLQGVLLENEGGAGSAYSHWEVRTLGYEIMNAAVQNDDYASISNFTLNILEDSGWYKVDYAAAKLTIMNHFGEKG